MSTQALDAHPAQDPSENKPRSPVSHDGKPHENKPSHAPPNVYERIALRRELRRQLRRQMLRQPAPETPERAARRARRIRILRAVSLIGRRKCNCAVATRAVGLGREAMQELYDELDLRKIPRQRKGVRRVLAPRTQDYFDAFVPPSSSLKRFWRLVLQPSASMVIAGRQKRIVISKCIVCGESFAASQQKRRFCGGTCRVRHWRAQR
jgi:hypothetical protein